VLYIIIGLIALLVFLIVYLTFKYEHWFKKQNEIIDTRIKVITVGVALITICIIQGQLISADKQTEAIWESFRPALGIVPIYPSRDIKLQTDSIINSKGEVVSNNNKYYYLSFSVKNYGQSPALLSTIFYNLFKENGKGIREDTCDQSEIIIVQTESMVFESPNLFNIKDTSFLQISIKYSLDMSDPPEYWMCTKKYGIYYENNSWHCKVLNDKQYEKYLSTVK